jgi:hypothetical protein
MKGWPSFEENRLKMTYHYSQYTCFSYLSKNDKSTGNTTQKEEEEEEEE